MIALDKMCPLQFLLSKKGISIGTLKLIMVHLDFTTSPIVFSKMAWCHFIWKLKCSPQLGMELKFGNLN